MQVGLPLSKWTAMEAERRKSFDAVVFVYDTTHIDSLKQVAAVVAGDESKSELIDTACVANVAVALALVQWPDNCCAQRFAGWQQVRHNGKASGG